MSEYAGRHSPDIQRRLDNIAVKLGTMISAIHPRLSDPEQRYTAGDVSAAALTYGEIVHRLATNESPSLPPGFTRYSDPEIDCLLMEGHLDRIDAALATQSASVGPARLAGFGVHELQDIASAFSLEWTSALHPTVEGYSWYRGYLVPTQERTAALLLTPWMQPWMQGGSPFPILYIAGEPNPTDLRQIVADYNTQSLSPSKQG